MKRPRPQENDIASAALMTEYVVALESALDLNAAGLDVSRGTLRRPGRRRPVWALLSGGSSPYSWTQRIESSAGTWATGPASGTADAREVNAVGSLGGTTARLYPDPLGGWRFQSVRKGTQGCPAGDLVTFHVEGCNDLPVAGASVTFNGESITTDALGVAIFAHPGAGTFTRAVTPPVGSRFATPVLSDVTYTGCGDAAYIITLLAAFPYGCHCGRCVDPIANSYTLSDANTSIILDPDGTGGWRGCYLLPGQTVRLVSNTTGRCITTESTAAVSIGYILNCPNEAGYWTLSQGWSACLNNLTGTWMPIEGRCILGNASGLRFGTARSSSAVQASAPSAPNSCAPVVLSFSIVDGFVNGGVTVTE